MHLYPPQHQHTRRLPPEALDECGFTNTRGPTYAHPPRLLLLLPLRRASSGGSAVRARGRVGSSSSRGCSEAGKERGAGLVVAQQGTLGQSDGFRQRPPVPCPQRVGIHGSSREPPRQTAESGVQCRAHHPFIDKGQEALAPEGTRPARQQPHRQHTPRERMCYSTRRRAASRDEEKRRNPDPRHFDVHIFTLQRELVWRTVKKRKRRNCT
jgi:hypothetical protein